VAVAYGAAENTSAGKARRIAALIDEHGRVAKIYDPGAIQPANRQTAA